MSGVKIFIKLVFRKSASGLAKACFLSIVFMTVGLPSGYRVKVKLQKERGE